MQVYDRVIPVRSEYTLIILAAGVFISILIELGMVYKFFYESSNRITLLITNASKVVFIISKWSPCIIFVPIFF